MIKIILSIISISLFFVNANTQNIPEVIVNNGGIELAFPWAGGMNSMQFGEIDINMDGKNDLVALDRDGVFNVISDAYEGNRILCFINNGQTNEINYSYSASYSQLFPQLYNWAVFVDYNMDGKTDIFTYSPGWGGIKVYKNISNESLKFELVVNPFLKSLQGGGYTNIFVTYADYPAIYDIDGDGDLDIITFGTLGTFVDLHKNMSMETYGSADSLLFERTEHCWGRFAESEESNLIYLDTCRNNNPDYENKKERHTGSTFLILDLNNDNLPDCLLGDIDYPNLIALINGGSNENTLFTSYITMFPNENQQANLFSMPVASYIDVNNDEIKDLLISPFDPSIYKSENKNSVWLYLNNGSNSNPNFELYSKNFLQNQMLDFGSCAFPSIYDIDDDGLKDLIIGNYGFYQYSFYESGILNSVYQSRIDFYKNIGTNTSPKFQLWKTNLGDLWKENLLSLSPTIGDLDNDGKNDLIVGNSDGSLLYLHKNDNEYDNPQLNYANIDVGDFSYPQLFDLDKDGLLDLLIGEKNGNINYYKNIGSKQNAEFVLITDSLGGINVSDYDLSYFGYSTPYFFNLEDGTTELVVGSEQGQIYYFKNIDNNLDGKFFQSDNLSNLLDTTDISFDRGIRTSAAIADLNSDGRLEMIAGNYSGGLELFSSTIEVLPGFSENIEDDRLKIFPNPASNILKIETEKGIEIKGIKLFSDNGILMQSTNHLQETNNKYFTLNLEVKNGVYIIQIELKDNIIRRKIIVIK